MTYFEKDDPFADFVVHEAAHVFHNWKRESVGLRHTRYREWLLEIDFTKREEFAYACEAYHSIVEQATNRADRRRLLAEYADRWAPSSDQVAREELLSILAEAVEARNGWKRILSRCAPAASDFRSRRRSPSRPAPGQLPEAGVRADDEVADP